MPREKEGFVRKVFMLLKRIWLNGSRDISDRRN